MESASPGAVKSREGSARSMCRRVSRMVLLMEQEAGPRCWGGAGLPREPQPSTLRSVLLTQPRLVDLPPHRELACVPPQALSFCRGSQGRPVLTLGWPVLDLSGDIARTILTQSGRACTCEKRNLRKANMKGPQGVGAVRQEVPRPLGGALAISFTSEWSRGHLSRMHLPSSPARSNAGLEGEYGGWARPAPEASS